jgi:GNAT superfamily N-acetyltransferase
MRTTPTVQHIDPKGFALTTTTPDVAIRTATAADISGISHILAEAFRHGPVADWLVPDAEQRYGIYYDLFSMLAAHAITTGTVHVTAELSAAALWQPRITRLWEPAGFPERLLAATGAWADRFVMLDTTLGAHHPGGPHHHLGYLGVHPLRQSGGIGAALLRHHHHILDAARLPAYLVAGDERSRDYYQRHRYHCEGRLTLPDRGPSLWPMWRAPGVSESTPSPRSASSTQPALDNASGQAVD